MPLAQIRDRRNRALERKRPPVVCQEEFSVDELGLNPAITVTQKVLRELPESIATARHKVEEGDPSSHQARWHGPTN